MVVIADLENGRSEFATKYLLNRNQSYVLILDRDGNELMKFGNRALEFDDELIKNIKATGAEYRIEQEVLVEYLLTWINSGINHQSQIEDLVSQLDSPNYATRESASQSLASLGEPTYQFLINYEAADVESNSRLRALGKKLEIHREIIIRDGLDHNVKYLAKHAANNPYLLDHLYQILPEDVEANEIGRWWNDNGQRFNWNTDDKQFVPQDVSATTVDDLGNGEKNIESFVGHWKIEFTNGITQQYVIQDDQSVSVSSSNSKRSSRGRMEVTKNECRIAFEDDRAERWTRVGDRVIVEHWFPASKSPKVQPVLGIGEPIKPETLSTVTGGVEFLYKMEVAKMVRGATAPHGNGIHEFIDVPEELLGRNYANRGGYLGIARFRVLKKQTIFLAMYGGEWGVGGNSSGGWKEEVVPREKLEAQGWKEIAGLPVKETKPEKLNPPSWIVFARDCQAGESFAIRNHKYQAPIVIWGPQNK